MMEDIYDKIEDAKSRAESVGGRPTDAEMQKHIMECVESGLGYKAAVPKLIELGYVKYGRCTVSYRQYEYARCKYSKVAVLRMQMEKSLVNWAKKHEDEILEYIRTRAEEDGCC